MTLIFIWRGATAQLDDDLTTRFLVNPYRAIIDGTESRTLGVVVECSRYDGLVGMGTVRFSRVQFNDEVLPLAFLDGLKVQKDFRGNGLGYQIAGWSIQKAREEGVFIVYSFTRGNFNCQVASTRIIMVAA